MKLSAARAVRRVNCMNNTETKLLNILRDELALVDFEIEPGEPLSQKRLDTDDLSYLFVPAVEEAFGVKLSLIEWKNADTIRDIAELLNQKSCN